MIRLDRGGGGGGVGGGGMPVIEVSSVVKLMSGKGPIIKIGQTSKRSRQVRQKSWDSPGSTAAALVGAASTSGAWPGRRKTKFEVAERIYRNLQSGVGLPAVGLMFDPLVPAGQHRTGRGNARNGPGDAEGIRRIKKGVTGCVTGPFGLVERQFFGAQPVFAARWSNSRVCTTALMLGWTSAIPDGRRRIFSWPLDSGSTSRAGKLRPPVAFGRVRPRRPLQATDEHYAIGGRKSKATSRSGRDG